MALSLLEDGVVAFALLPRFDSQSAKSSVLPFCSLALPLRLQFGQVVGIWPSWQQTSMGLWLAAVPVAIA